MIALQNIWRNLKRNDDLSLAETNDDHFFNKLRKKEFARLDCEDHIYLDYTGGCVYPESLVKAHQKYLRQGVFGNPHSTNPASLLSEKYVNDARERVLAFFNASDYYCIFTNNASAALQIVGESYPFNQRSHLLLTADNHNSVNGIREYCRNEGGTFSYAPMNYEDLRINESELIKHLDGQGQKSNRLFAYPAQSNVSGVRHSLSWIEIAHNKGWDVLLDAAAFVPTSKLDLSIYKPDFVSISFYKMFGYPTGIGCLLVRKSKFEKLIKPAYAGGTITLSSTLNSAAHPGYFLKNGHERFENGTVNYIGIPAVANGLNFIETIGIERISRRVRELSLYFLQELKKIRHDNGSPVIKLYGPEDVHRRGGTFLLNFFDVNEQKYPFQAIEEMANGAMISFRTGCFCNPGIDELNHCIVPDQLKEYFTSRSHGDYYDFINFSKNMRGAVRISMGLATTKTDLRKFTCFVKKLLNKTIPVQEQTSTTLSEIPVSGFFQTFRIAQ